MKAKKDAIFKGLGPKLNFLSEPSSIKNYNFIIKWNYLNIMIFGPLAKAKKSGACPLKKLSPS